MTAATSALVCEAAKLKTSHRVVSKRFPISFGCSLRAGVQSVLLESVFKPVVL